MVIRHEKKKMLLIMGIIFFSYCMGIFKSLPLHTSTDELGAIVGAAALAGRDWSGVIENSGYYGFAYYSLFFGVFKLTTSPIIIYRTIIITTSFLRVLIIPIAYYIAKYYLKIKSEAVLYLCSILMPFLYTTSVGVISNEYILELLVWVIILLVCKIMQYQDNKVKRNIYFCLLILSCFYSLLIHTRALVLIIAVAITFLLISIIDKNRQNRCWLLFLSIGILVSYLVSKVIISFYQSQIYKKSGEELRNATYVVSTKLSIFDSDTWSVWFHMLLGILNSEVLVTGSLFLIAIITFCFYLFDLKKGFIREERKYCNIIFFISALCIGGTICAFLASPWFEGMLSSWEMKGMEAAYSYKGLTYIRYWDIFTPPFILCSISVLNQLKYKKILNMAAAIYVLLQVCFMNFILPLIQQNVSAASPFFGLAGYHFEDGVSSDFYDKALIISTLVFLLIFIFIRTKYKNGILILLFLFMFFQQNNKVYLYDNKVKEAMASKVMASFEKKCELEIQGINIDNIYLCNVSPNLDANWKLNSIAQFYFNEYTLQEKIPEQMGENDIIISDGKSEEIQKQYKDIHCYVMDENEVWYTYLNL